MIFPDLLAPGCHLWQGKKLNEGDKCCQEEGGLKRDKKVARANYESIFRDRHGNQNDPSDGEKPDAGVASVKGAGPGKVCAAHDCPEREVEQRDHHGPA